MTSILSVLLLSSLAALAATQCGPQDHPNCVFWQRNNQFCTNPGYPLATRQAYCAKFCLSRGIDLNCGPPPTGKRSATGEIDTDSNPDGCKRWAAKAYNPICITATEGQKKHFCAETCAFEINPTADCALYTVTGTTFARGTTTNRTATPGTAVPSGAIAGTTKLSRAFAASGCTMKLFTAVDADTTQGEIETFVGTATKQFFKVSETSKEALSYTCVCA